MLMVSTASRSNHDGRFRTCGALVASGRRAPNGARFGFGERLWLVPGTDGVMGEVTEPDRFRQMFDDHYSAVWSYCRRRLPEAEVDDATADVFATAWRRLADVPDEPVTLAWLYRTAYYTIAHVVRSRYRRDRVAHRLGSLPQPTAELVDAGDDTADIVTAINSLAFNERELVRLLAWEQLSHDEIAAVLGLTTNAVAIRVHRVRKRIDGFLKGQAAVGNIPDRQAMTQAAPETTTRKTRPES